MQHFIFLTTTTLLIHSTTVWGPIRISARFVLPAKCPVSRVDQIRSKSDCVKRERK